MSDKLQTVDLPVNMGPAHPATHGVFRMLLTIDGDSAPLLSYNHAFLAFRAPAGQHVAVLRYWPRGFVHGLLLSGITLVATLFLGLSRRLVPSR